jgi:acetyl-CoA carboxylase biotin carboxylase subunit/propionyl-CoA carboxylase alpha chain
MKDINYTSAGTVEFILDMDTQKFYFLEVNTRLQVEHGITELVTGLDIVSLMIEMASGKPLELRQTDIVRNRWAMEVRVNAEDPKNFSPSFGCLTTLKIPRGPAVRILEGAEEGSEIPPYYDSLIMLLMASGRNRKDAISVMDRALRSHLKVKGVKTLQPLLINIIHHPDFRVGNFSTNFIEKNYNDLTQNIPDKEDEDEVMRIARYVAERSALGIPEWI